MYREDGIIYTARSLEQHLKDMNEALRTDTYVHGIKSKTPLIRLPNFDFIKAFNPEYMHSCCLGIIKMFIKLWTDSKYSKEDWHLGKDVLSVANKRLLNTTPPHEVTRIMASFDDLSVWKASMFRSFCLYYFPVLEDLMQPVYFEHFAKFSYGMYCLLQDKVNLECIGKVDILLKHFVKETEFLYGKEHITMNLHLATHLAESVVNWGCLWATSTFIPEWFNGELAKPCNGTQAVAEQMVKNYLIKIVVREEATTLIQNYDLPIHVSSLLIELLQLPIDNNYISRKVTRASKGTIELLGNPIPLDQDSFAALKLAYPLLDNCTIKKGF